MFTENFMKPENNEHLEPFELPNQIPPNSTKTKLKFTQVKNIEITQEDVKQYKKIDIIQIA